jgi:hypothetical protein
MPGINGIFRSGTSQSLAVTTTSATLANPFGAQTYAVRLSVSLNAGVTGLHYKVTETVGPAAAVLTDPALPVTWVENILVSPGQKITAITDAGTATLIVTELS